MQILVHRYAPDSANQLGRCKSDDEVVAQNLKPIACPLQPFNAAFLKELSRFKKPTEKALQERPRRSIAEYTIEVADERLASLMQIEELTARQQQKQIAADTLAA